MAKLPEKWKWIRGYRGLYKVSNKGRVKSVARKVWREGHEGKHPHKGHWIRFRETILQPGATGPDRNYLFVVLSKNGKTKGYKVAKLVALAFVLNPENKPEVNHKDGNTFNNTSSNLEWSTRTENEDHAYKLGLKTRNDKGQFGGAVQKRKLCFFFAGVRHGKDCDPRDAVHRELNVMTTFFAQREGKKTKKKNKLMMELQRRRLHGTVKEFHKWTPNRGG